MDRLGGALLVFASWAVGATAARADDFSIELKAQDAKTATLVEAKYPMLAKKAERPLLNVADKTAVTVKWTVRRTDQGAIAKDVLVHFFVVTTEKPNQQDVPKLTQGVAAESALKMDFKAQDKAEGEITLTLPRAGCYLIRLELKGAAGKDPFAALDVVVN